jgi:hypothetical protein
MNTSHDDTPMAFFTLGNMIGHFFISYIGVVQGAVNASKDSGNMMMD